SASSRLFQEIREKRGMAYAVYTFASQYTDTGLVGVYVGTREENLNTCVDITREQIADIAAGSVRESELARAKENLKGRIMLSMESTSNRMSRLGRSLITDTELLSLDRIIAEIEAVEAEALAVLAAALSEAGHEVVGIDLGDPVALEGCDAAVDFTQPDAVAGNVATCVAAGIPCVIGTTGFDRDEVEREALAVGVPVFHAPNFAIGAVLMMRFAAEAVRHMPNAEIIELHHETKLDAPSGTAKATADAMGGNVPIHSRSE